MGQLNSNDVPPNPFVHGWKGTVVVPPPSANPPPPRIVQTISPVQQAYRIVSQPLQPSTAAKRSSSEFPVGVILAVGLIITLLILIFVATASARQKSQVLPSAITNQVSISQRQNHERGKSESNKSIGLPKTVTSATTLLPVEQRQVLNRAETSNSTMSSETPTPASTPTTTVSYESNSHAVQVAQSFIPNSDRVAIPAPAPPEEPTPIPVPVRPPLRTLPLLPDPPAFK